MFPLTFSVTCQCHQNTNSVLVTPRDILVTPSLDRVPVSSLLPSSPRLTARHRGQTQFLSHNFLSNTISSVVFAQGMKRTHASPTGVTNPHLAQCTLQAAFPETGASLSKSLSPGKSDAFQLSDQQWHLAWLLDLTPRPPALFHKEVPPQKHYSFTNSVALMMFFL